MTILHSIQCCWRKHPIRLYTVSLFIMLVKLGGSPSSVFSPPQPPHAPEMKFDIWVRFEYRSYSTYGVDTNVRCAKITSGEEWRRHYLHMSIVYVHYLSWSRPYNASLSFWPWSVWYHTDAMEVKSLICDQRPPSLTLSISPEWTIVSRTVVTNMVYDAIP